MRYFVPSWSSVLALLVVGLLGFCLLQREELQYVRSENQLLVQQTRELDDLRIRMGWLPAGDGIVEDRRDGGQ